MPDVAARKYAPPSAHRRGGMARVSELKTRERAVVVASVIALACAALIATVPNRHATNPEIANSAASGSPAASSDMVAQIGFPLAGESVTSPLTVTGTGVLPSNRGLWLLLMPEEDLIYYVTTDSEIAVSAIGTWDSDLHLGRGECDEGTKYALYAVASPLDGVIAQEIHRRPAGQYSVRLRAIPSDATILASIDLTLGDYRGTRQC